MSSSWEDVGVAVASMVLATFSMFDKPENVFLITFTGSQPPYQHLMMGYSTQQQGVDQFAPRCAAAISAGFDILGSTVPLPNDPALFSSLTRFLASSALQPTMVGTFVPSTYVTKTSRKKEKEKRVKVITYQNQIPIQTEKGTKKEHRWLEAVVAVVIEHLLHQTQLMMTLQMMFLCVLGCHHSLLSAVYCPWFSSYEV
nr:hypothetical protein Iba_chr10aCG3870 [Ipomoea batatas]